MWMDGWMENTWTNRVRTLEVLHTVKGERYIPRRVKYKAD